MLEDAPAGLMDSGEADAGGGPAEAAVEVALVMALAEALHRCGAPAHRLEGTMRRLSQALSIQAEVFATPTMLLVSLGDRTRLLRVSPGDTDLSRLVAVDAVAAWLSRGALAPAEALEQVRAIMAAPPRYGERAVLLAFGLISASAAVFFGGGGPDIAAGLGLGLLVGLSLTGLGQHAHTAHVSTLVVAFGSALAASALSLVLPVAPLTLTLAALIVLLPGFSLTLGMAELSTGNLSAGSARLAGVAVTFLHLAVGAAAGWHLLPVEVTAGPGGQPPWVEPLAQAATAGAHAVLFQARVRDTGVILCSAALAFYGARLGTAALGGVGGGFAAALLVTLFSNAQARVRDVPSSVALVPGILLLVPGSVGFRGVGALLDQRTLSGLDTAFSAILIAAALVAGLLVANTLLPARRDL